MLQEAPWDTGARQALAYAVDGDNGVGRHDIACDTACDILWLAHVVWFKIVAM